jgi:hypothetical protein
MLLLKKRLDNFQGLFSYGGFSFEKRLFSEANIPRSKADFDPRPLPMKNMNLLLAVYTHFREVTDQRMVHKSPLKSTFFYYVTRNLLHKTLQIPFAV